MAERQSKNSDFIDGSGASSPELVSDGLRIIEANYAKVMTFRGKLRTADQLTDRAREKAHVLYKEALDFVQQSPLTPSERADLTVQVFDSMTKHLSYADRTAADMDLTMEQLPAILGEPTYAKIGREYATALGDGPFSANEEDLPAIFETCIELPREVRDRVLWRFIELGLLKYDADDQLVFGKSRKAAEHLRTGAVETARLIHQIIDVEVPTSRPTTLVEGVALGRKHDAETALSSVELRSETKRVKVLPINELRIGHQDYTNGLELVVRTIDHIRSLDPEERPTVILLTNVIQGEFKHRQSGRRATLATGLESNDAQFDLAKVLIDNLRELDIPIVLSLGRDDASIAHDNAIDIMNEIRGIAKQGGKENFIPYYSLNKIQEDARMQRHKNFELEYAIPLSYRLGRALRSADEVKAATDGVVTTSEHIALYAFVKHGVPLPPELGIDPALVVGLEQWLGGVYIANDVDIHLSTDAQSTEIQYRHSVSGFSPETLLQNHMDALLGMLGAIGTNGGELPDLLMTGGSQEAVYATRSGAGAMSLPGLTDPTKALGRKQQYTAVQGDPTRRFNTLRKRPSAPAIETYEKRDTGEIVLSYINKDLMDRADSLPRMAVVELCDFQIGSPTARPDYQIKYLSYLIELAKEMPVAIQFAGDIIHGNIYPGFSDESQAIGLIKIESQKQMVSMMLKKAFWNVPDSLLESFVDILVQQGNHDEIQKKRTPNNHDNNIDYIIKDFEHIMDRDGQESRVRHNSIFRTETGVPVPTWMGRSEYGAYNILTAHYHIDRGMKGNTGGLPVYHPYARAVGLGSEEQANILMGAHWHNPQSAVLGNKLVVVGGAMAEQSQFEDMRGYSAKLAGTVVFIGGSKPPEVMSVTPEALDYHGVRNGWFTPENLADQGFHDDPGFDVTKHGPYSPDYLPKSGLQKALLYLARQASQLTMFEAPQQGENIYGPDGEPLKLNSQTQRILAVAATKAAQL
ncbi:MAG: hypothetical protein WBP22_00505 [Candidatus Saccharimonas sp.]